MRTLRELLAKIWGLAEAILMTALAPVIGIALLVLFIIIAVLVLVEGIRKALKYGSDPYEEVNDLYEDLGDSFSSTLAKE